MSDRLTRMRELMQRHDQPAVLLHRPCNFRYLSGYAGEGCALVTRGGQYIFTDFRYVEQAQLQAPGWTVVRTDRDNPWFRALSGVLQAERPGRLAVETDYVTVDEYERLKANAGGAVPEPIRARPELLRMVKDDAEQELLTRAESITARTFNAVLGSIRPGMTELELRAELEHTMFRMGAHGVGFSTIIASGENGSLCHAVPGERRLAVGDFITMDFGASVGGYTADMTRTVALGSVTDEMRSVYGIVLEAQMRALDAMKAGERCDAMDAIARDCIAQAGYGEYFGHSLGHATGLQIHEAPGCRAGSEEILECGMTMTVEPGIYLPGRFGVRIEDMVIIEQGGVRNLASEAPKELIIL